MSTMDIYGYKTDSLLPYTFCMSLLMAGIDKCLPFFNDRIHDITIQVESHLQVLRVVFPVFQKISRHIYAIIIGPVYPRKAYPNNRFSYYHSISLNNKSNRTMTDTGSITLILIQIWAFGYFNFRQREIDIVIFKFQINSF